MSSPGRKNTASPLADLIGSVVHDLGLGDRIRQATVEETWRVVAGEQIARVTGRVRFASGRLTIQLTSSAWRQALSMQREAWRSRVNESLGSEEVVEIVFR